MTYSIELTEYTRVESNKELYSKLGCHNKKLRPFYKNHLYYAFSLKNKNKLLGGIEGYVWLGINHIDRIFICKDLRGKDTVNSF